MSASVLPFPSRSFMPNEHCDCARCELQGLARRLGARISAGAGSLLVPASDLDDTLADLLATTDVLLATAVEVPR